MLSSNFIFWNFFYLFIYIYAEMCYSLIFFSIFKNLKFFNISYTKKILQFIFKNDFFFFVNNLIIFLLITWKLSFSANNMLSFIFIYLLISNLLFKFYKTNIMFINFNIIFFLLFFIFINNLLTFFLFIELYAIIFYFFFLNNTINNKLTLLQYKNMLLLYLFNNFFTTILFLLGIFFVINFYGSVNFNELKFLVNTNVYWQIYFLVISFTIKLSLPGFHFLKIEIYKYLNIDIVILFSVITLYINYSFFIFFFNQNIIFSLLNSFKFLHILLIFIFIFFIQKLKVHNIQEFISYSGFATNGLIILNFLLKIEFNSIKYKF